MDYVSRLLLSLIFLIIAFFSLTMSVAGAGSQVLSCFCSAVCSSFTLGLNLFGCRKGKKDAATGIISCLVSLGLLAWAARYFLFLIQSILN
jgi:hypothetical protein